MYAFTVRFRGSFDEAIARTTAELKREGFGVLTDIDVRATMKVKLGVEGRPYRILGACNPKAAHAALQAEPDIGVLMPCSVVVRGEEDGSVSVVFTDVRALFSLVGRPDVAPLAAQVDAGLRRAAAALGAAAEDCGGGGG